MSALSVKLLAQVKEEEKIQKLKSKITHAICAREKICMIFDINVFRHDENKEKLLAGKEIWKFFESEEIF